MAKFSFGMPVMSLTEAAAARLREIADSADHPIAGLRVGVKNAGCAGMAYALDTIDKIDPDDDVVEDKGVRVYIDPKAVLFLLGSVMDFKTSKMSSGFVFQNPNEVSACGCGESVNLKPAEIAPANA